MTGTKMQQELIIRVNDYLNTDIEYDSSLLDWISNISLSPDRETVKINIDDYKDAINKLNKIINLRHSNERYSFASEIQEELEAYEIEIRVCSICSSLMIEGYVIDGGSEYYCSDECLKVDMTLEKFEDLYNDGSTETYWTEWY